MAFIYCSYFFSLTSKIWSSLLCASTRTKLSEKQNVIGHIITKKITRNCFVQMRRKKKKRCEDERLAWKLHWWFECNAIWFWPMFVCWFSSLRCTAKLVVIVFSLSLSPFCMMRLKIEFWRKHTANIFIMYKLKCAAVDAMRVAMGIERNDSIQEQKKMKEEEEEKK